MIVLYLTEDPDGIIIKSDDPVIGEQGSVEIFLGSYHDYSNSPTPPHVGERLKYYIVKENGEFTSHPSDWVVERTEHITRERTEDDKMVIAWCKKSPK
jgi:hypothetical protein